MAKYNPSHNYGPEHAASLAEPNPQKRLHKVSDAQLAANRANAAKSTGPRTPAGKTRCALNACRHLLTGQVSALTEEDRAAQAAFINPIIEELNPATPIESHLAQSIAIGMWRLNRIRAAEDNVFALGHFGPPSDLDVDHPELHAALTQARVYLESAKDLERATLYEQRIHRTLAKDTAQLEALQLKRKAVRTQALDEAAQLSRLSQRNGEEEAPETQETTTTSTPNGSVFSTAEIAAHHHRKHALKAAAYYDQQGWDTPYPYPHAA